MPLFTRGGRSVLFVHVPKTGGTTVEHAFRAAGWTVSLFSDHVHAPEDDALRPYRITMPQHYEAALLEQTIRVSAVDHVFMIVREPVARFRSEYAMQVRDPRAGSAEEVEAWAAVRFAAYARNRSVLDNHLRPQVDFFLPEARVYRYEEGISAILAELDAELGLALDLDGIGHHLDSSTGLRSTDVEVGPVLDTFLRETYADDFEVFGYDAVPSNLTGYGRSLASDCHG